MKVLPLEYSLNCRGKLITLAVPRVMAIVNLSSESFYQKSVITGSSAQLVDQVGQLLEEGADIIDLGGASSKPGQIPVDFATEMGRVIPATEVLAKAFPEAIFSIDTFRASVAGAALAAGAHIINDISAGTADEDMWPLIGTAQTPFIAMHRSGPSATMQVNPDYPEGVVETVYSFFTEVLAKAEQHRVHDVLLDPGFGFGKTIAHNYTLLARLSEFGFLRRPILVGLSRKGMLSQVTGRASATALAATTAAHMLALQGGANILRVHDVAPARDAIAVFAAYRAHNPYPLASVPLV